MTTNNRNSFVAYYRVSTEKQGRSGLGLEAQQSMVARFVQSRMGVVIAEFSEVGSGKVSNNANRLELAKALALAKDTHSTLIVAKLDRLARNCTMLEAVQAAGVPFIVADNPQANELTLGLLMVLARNERELCSQRTKAALEALKQRGVKLGSQRDDTHRLTAQDAAKGREVRHNAAKVNDNNVRAWALVQHLIGSKSLRQIAETLNAAHFTTSRGKSWNASQVQRLQVLMA